MFSPFLVGAQVSDIRFTRFDNLPSLQENDIYDIMQDKGGFLWFGTITGLYRYDGYNLKHYQADGTGGDEVPAGPVWRLHIDRENLLWLVIQGKGIASLNTKTGECIYY